MSFDGLMVRRITQLLDNKINGCYINRIFQISNNDFIFSLYKKDFKDKLVISINNNASYLSLSSYQYNTHLDANHFLNVLRHHLEGGIILSIYQLSLDRIISIKISKEDELGVKEIKHLHIELTGKMTNLIVTKEDETIIDCLHRLGPITNRTIMPGAIYHLPPAPNLKDPLSEEYNLNTDLQGQFFGFSKNLEKEVRYRLNLGEALNDIVKEILSSDKVYIYPSDYHLIPFKHLSKEPLIKDWDKGITDFYLDYQTTVRKQEASKELLNIAKKESKKYLTKIGRLEDELTKASDSDTYRYYGDLIYAYAPNLSIKDKEIVIRDEEQSKEVLIPLDERYSLKDNAQKFYKKYQKLRNSKNILEEQIEIAKNEYEYFELLKVQIQDANKEELEQIKQELASLGYIKAQIRSNKKKVTKYLPHTYTSPSGIQISVGMNNLQNDYLTHTMAKYNEYFFHVKDYPGSHVVVHSTEPLSEETIRYAANLAAYFSKARLSSTIPVNYTLVKNVKKHPSNKPGLVLLKTYKTIYIDPIEPK